MKRAPIWRFVIAATVLGMCGTARAAENRELKVHLAQANNNSPYAFVRAKFEPGEVSDPWAVRFFTPDGKEVPYFVWDAVSWKEAREGRADWGHRYALLNHAPGNIPEALAAGGDKIKEDYPELLAKGLHLGALASRGEKIEEAKRKLPELGAELAAEDAAAKQHANSLCAVLYLLRYQAQPYGKEKLTLRIYPATQVQPLRTKWTGPGAAAQAGELRFCNLPSVLAVSWKGKELFRYAGFAAGGAEGTASHADPARPFSVEVTEGIITKVAVSGQTAGRQGSAMDWQCTYWLFPEGSYVALEGFNLGNSDGYQGGKQTLSTWEGAGDFTQKQTPLWTAPWWVYQVGQAGFVAAHLYYDVELALGYGNNPFTVSTEGKNTGPEMELAGRRLGLCWGFSLTGGGASELLRRQTPPWTPRADWLYRQYAVGVGTEQADAERALRGVVGAAAGWIDRPFDEEKIAACLVSIIQKQKAESGASWYLPLWIAPAVLNPDQTTLKAVLSEQRNRPNMGSPARTEDFIGRIQATVDLGGSPWHVARNSPIRKASKIFCEGWENNPAYHACKMSAYVRFYDHFDLPHPEQEDRKAILRYADFTLKVLGGTPFDLDRMRSYWMASGYSNRSCMMIPLMLHAYTLTGVQEYARVAVTMFHDYMAIVEKNPHGYWNAWTFKPTGVTIYDPVYNPIGYGRGITSFWSDGMVDLIGREKASNFTAAQARYFVTAGLLSDSLETPRILATYTKGVGDNMNQIGQYLWDDYPFYRGLLGDLVRWSAAAKPGSRVISLDIDGGPGLRWALSIGKDTRWNEHHLRHLPGKGFTLSIRNSSPWKQPTLSLTGKDVGWEPAAQEAVWLRMEQPAYRVLAELTVTPSAEQLKVHVSHCMKLRLCYTSLFPRWTDATKLRLTPAAPSGAAKPLSDGVTWSDGTVAWDARPGDYVLH